MGGINHQPTSNVSLAFSVPGAEALTKAMSELMLGNVSIEQLIQLNGGTNFGVEKQRLIEAGMHFDLGISELEIAGSYVDRIIDMLGNSSYVPFDISSVNAELLIEDCINAGLLTNSHQVHEAVSVTTEQGYQGIFFAIKDRIENSIMKLITLRNTTNCLVDGPEGTQGYFWQNVEANRNTWRPDFMAALTSLTDLIGFWSASAAICTEVHLVGTNSGSLMSNVNKPTLS